MMNLNWDTIPHNKINGTVWENFNDDEIKFDINYIENNFHKLEENKFSNN